MWEIYGIPTTIVGKEFMISRFPKLSFISFLHILHSSIPRVLIADWQPWVNAWYIIGPSRFIWLLFIFYKFLKVIFLVLSPIDPQ